MSTNLTEKQQRAVDTDEKRVLVSAAAGSGKTTVLAKRVASVIEKDKQTDIANMLVMTFTNAAAGEMKRRISKELKNKAAANRDARLKAQAERVEYAPISTYHSFCIKLLRENCAAAQVSPNFRLLDETESSGLMQAALRDMFDMLYETGADDPLRKGFISLLSRFSARADDNKLEDIILNVYKTARTKPDWQDWLKKGLDDSPQKADRIKASYEERAKNLLAGFASAWIKALELLKTEESKLISTDSKQYKIFSKQYQNDEAALSPAYAQKLAQQDVYEAQKQLRGFGKPRWANGADPDIRKPVEAQRAKANEFYKEFNGLPIFRDDFYGELKRQMLHTHKDVGVLAELIIMFDRLYSVKKKERNAVDFDEALLRALMVLRALKEDGSNYGAKFTHIFVDEFQDTNPVQSEIIRILQDDGACVFMVGDIKQCIYRFNNADPGIFKGVEQDIAVNSGGEIIKMNDNFRSEKCVIDAVNALMELVMSRNLGEVDYNQDERLISGAGGTESAGCVKILLCREQAEDEGDDENTSMSVIAESAEADAIAGHLANVLAEKDAGGNPRFTPGDAAVLLRKTGPLMPQLVRALERKGVSAVIEAKSAQDSPEIELFINLLRIVSNPMQDIPLVSVMLSPIGGFTEDDLVKIRTASNDREADAHTQANEPGEKKHTTPFYTAAYNYKKSFDNDLAKRLVKFYDETKELNMLSQTYSLKDFIGYIAERYAFDTFFSEVKNGNGKRETFYELLAQIEGMLPQSGNSLYGLIGALDAVKKKEGRFVKNTKVQKRAKSVRIMTMHNSKGLEFPIVYVAGLASGVNVRDLTAPFLKDGEEGVCAAHIQEGPHNTLLKQASYEYDYIKEKSKSQRMSEELRLLYVAMTRAKQRLYLTGTVKNPEDDALDKWKDREGDYDAPNMLDLIMRANVIKRVIDYSFVAPDNTGSAARPFDFDAHLLEVENTAPADVIELNETPEVQAKMSVSAIKHGKEGSLRSLLSVYDEDLMREYRRQAVEQGVPDVVAGAKIKGAALGTLMHRAIERMVKYDLDFKGAAADMLSRGLIDDDEYAACLDNQALAQGFYASPLYKRMRNSEKLITERRFFLKMAAGCIGINSDLPVTVQGGLDAAFLEDGKWVLVDYKTDNINQSSVADRAQTYKIQLDLYAKALNDITGIPVKEKHLYFLRPGCDYLMD